MFNKLRNRFLIVNLVIITFMILVAFASIYTITYQNVRRDIEMELHKVSDAYRKPMGKIGEPRHDDNRYSKEPMDKTGPPMERSVSFALQTDNEWNITSVNSRFDMEDEFYESAIQKVSATAMDGRFTLDDEKWAYTLQKNERGYSVVFLDVTGPSKIVTNLVYTFLAVGLAMLIVIYFISRFFANRSIAPVKEAFYKQKQFIADASHELKTPLAVINTNADVLLSNSEDTIEDQAKWLHHIKSETERMKKLTNDLLYLTEWMKLEPICSTRILT